jgi:hypothetical protein
MALTAALAQGAPGRADSLIGGDCGTVAPTFSPFGDFANYYFPANGGFESGATGWTLGGGAAVVDGNEPFYLHAPSDSHSLAIPAGGSASVTLCYGVLYPSLRFMVAGQDARVHVWISTKNLLGVVSILDGGTFTAGSAWTPSPQLSTLLSALAAPLGAKSMQLHVDVSGAAAQIDDLYVDPFVMRD